MAVATKVEPLMVGKPEPHMIETALSRLGTVRSATLMTGDQIRLEHLPQLIQQFTVEAKGDSNAQTLAIEKPAFLALAGHHRVGNWTELRQIVDQLVMLKDTHIVADVLKRLLNSASPTRPTGAFSEREWIMGGLKRNIVQRLHVLQDFQERRCTTK
ncbi:HAD hydrolase-like protein [Bradyrhizobium sp. LB14.3]|uniref:HAD hydrolase-like protein n=1 Tax=Bradyrhizobium sp. LB14.3 TaxID=3156328 RepID=UPI00339A12C8